MRLRFTDIAAIRIIAGLTLTMSRDHTWCIDLIIVAIIIRRTTRVTTATDVIGAGTIEETQDSRSSSEGSWRIHKVIPGLAVAGLLRKSAPGLSWAREFSC